MTKQMNSLIAKVAILALISDMAVAPTLAHAAASGVRPVVPALGVELNPEDAALIGVKTPAEEETGGTALENRLLILEAIEDLARMPLDVSVGEELLDDSQAATENIAGVDSSFEDDVAQNGAVKKKMKKKPGPKNTAVKKGAPGSKASAGKMGSATTHSAAGGQPMRDSRSIALKREEDRGRQAVKRGDYVEASKAFFGLLDKESNPGRLLQIRFILGRTLQEMKLHQVAAFPYYEIVRSEGKRDPKNKYVRQSLERLTVAADALESDILLTYALKQINEEDFPAGNRDMLYFRRGELRLRDKNFIEAAREFNRVRGGSTFYSRARYQLGLSLTEANQLEKAESVYASLAAVASDAGVTNKSRVNALMGKARTLYQRKMYADAIDAYREVPRDTEQWHEALFESTWAALQDGRFRSALSNFHSLHSPFYDEFYQPESLLLRSIVYHYICRYDEMEKTLGLFERVYGPVQREMRATLMAVSAPVIFYREIRKVDDNLDGLKTNVNSKRQLPIPFLVARQILREGDVKRSMAYIHNLEEEGRKIDRAPATWREARIGRYAKRVVARRLEATQVATGRLIRKHMERIQSELAGHFEQAGLIRLDMLSGKKEAVKKEIAGKGLVREKIDEEQDRSFFIQNGYDYWPFKGEFWLDEIGNYHYVGVKACE